MKDIYPFITKKNIKVGRKLKHLQTAKGLGSKPTQGNGGRGKEICFKNILNMWDGMVWELIVKTSKKYFNRVINYEAILIYLPQVNTPSPPLSPLHRKCLKVKRQKSKVKKSKSQKPKVKSQKSKVKSQKTKVKSQKSKVKIQKSRVKTLTQ